MEPTTLLTASNIITAYDQSTILWGVNLSVLQGTVTTVMGRNGVGKTTLLKTIMGLQKAREGQDKASELAKDAWSRQRDTLVTAIERGKEAFDQARDQARDKETV